MSVTPAPTAKSVWRQHLFMYATLAASTLFYIFMIMTAAKTDVPKPHLPKLLPSLLMGLAIATMLAAAAFGKVFAPRLGEQPLTPTLTDDPLTDAQRAALQRLYVRQLITWALSEAIAIYGFVLATLTRDLNSYWAFLSLSLASYALNRPRKLWFVAAIANSDAPPPTTT